MDRTEKEEYIIGYVSLISNKLSQAGDTIFPDITFKQWFLLMMISKMEPKQEKNINSISDVVGTSRQNIKKMLTSLETKGYVVIGRSTVDLRALKVELTDKTYQYFFENADIAAHQAHQLFKQFSIDEIDSFICNLQKLMDCLALNGERKTNDE